MAKKAGKKVLFILLPILVIASYFAFIKPEQSFSETSKIELMLITHYLKQVGQFMLMMS